MSEWPESMTLKPIVQWPGELTAAHRRQRSQFSATLSSTLATLKRELVNLKAKGTLMQIALREQDFRIDGNPRANSRPDHPGVILTFDSKQGALSYPCDTFTTWQDNLRAIALALEALRKVDRYGVTSNGQQYQGFKAIGSGIVARGPLSEEQALELLYKHGRTHHDIHDVNAAYRLAQRRTHPDMGGDGDDFDEVMRAGRALGLG